MNLCIKSAMIGWVLSVASGSTSWADDASLRQSPVPIKAEDVGVGRRVADFQFTSIDGAIHRLSDYGDCRAVVIAMTGTACPLCLKYTPSLAAIEQEYRDQSIQFVFVNPIESEKQDRLHDAVARHGLQGPYVQDRERLVTNLLAASTTTEVFVLDRARTLVYRGAVDDQYGFGYSNEVPRRRYLIDAIDAVLVDQLPPVSATSSPGCELIYGEGSPLRKPTEVTYHHQVARIMNRHCVECHRNGGIAPIPLETYPQVRDYLGMISSVVERGVMPPWFAAPMTGEPTKDDAREDIAIPQHWSNERSLSSIEQADLMAWIEADGPEGDPADAPLATHFPDGWLIGKPDAVFEFEQPVAVKATGTMPYRNVTIETNLDEGKWVRAIEVRPGNRSVVHHVIVSLQSDENDERSGYWGIYVPGNSTLDYPEGYAKWLPKGARLRFQMHYTPNGTATVDSTRLGLIFAKQPPEHEVKVTGIVDPRFMIPAGAINHGVTAKLDIPQNVHVLGFLPHMHLRGKAARYELVRGDQSEILLDVPRYDFNWQLCYRLSQPRPMGVGDVIRYTSWYDNSAENPANPDPSRDVRWGQQTYDEMHLGYVEYVVTGEVPESSRADSGPKDDGKRDRLFRRLDINADGFITREEVRERMPNDKSAATTIFDRLDLDQNDRIDRDELSQL